MTRVLCLVPARSGSVRVPHKNLAELGGTTLLARAVATAVDAFGSAYVSTDSDAYAEAARAAGALVPELRPAGLAGDSATMDLVAVHALRWAPEAEVIVVVQATSPFTTAADLRAVVQALDDAPEAATSLTAVEVDRTAGFALVDGPGGLARPLAPDLFDLRSQDLPRVTLPTGGAFATRIDRLRAGGPLLLAPYAVHVVPPERALDIDHPEDLDRARAQHQASNGGPDAR